MNKGEIMFSKKFGLNAKTVGSFIIFGMLIIVPGCEKTPKQGDMVSITDLPAWLSPYYAVITVWDNAGGKLYGAGGIEAVGDDGNVVFEIKDLKDKPWTGKNKEYEVRLELYKEEPSLTAIAAGNKGYEEICIWKKIVLPTQTESISLYKADTPMRITSEIDEWLKKYQAAVEKYVGIMDRVRGGDIYALIDATAQLNVLRPIMSEAYKYAPKMTEKQKQRALEISTKYQNNTLGKL
jgi:hypothetical protein